MRNTFIKTLFKESQKNKIILLLTGDLGFSVFEEYMEKLPNQFINGGVAEQNLTGVAAGLALEGKIPFIYSIVPFITMRNFEQIRNDICYNGANVKIVGVGAGFSYAIYGYTHYALEDVAILRTLPNMTILTPGDPIEAEFAMQQALIIKGPVYIRLGKAGEPNIHKNASQLKLGKSAIIKQGKDVALITSSIMLQTAFEVTQILEEKGISVQLMQMHTLKPFDTKGIIKASSNIKNFITLEEHTIYGGLGSIVAEVIAENSLPVCFKRIAVENSLLKVLGNQEYMRNAHGLSKEKIIKTILQIVKKQKT
jgi:transketolase